MAELYESREEQEQVILVAVSVQDEISTEASLDELAELVKTAGGVVEDALCRTGRWQIWQPILEAERPQSCGNG